MDLDRLTAAAVRTLCFTAVCSTLDACAGPPSPASGGADARHVVGARQLDAGGDDALVYAAVLDTVYTADGARDVSVQDSTAPPQGVPPLERDSSAGRHVRGARRGHLPGLRTETVHALFVAGPVTRALPRSLPTRVHVAWIPTGDVDRLVSRPGEGSTGVVLRSITRLSPVGYSADSAQALVYLSEACTALCGHGEYLLLARRGTPARWVVIARSLDWIS